MINVRNEIAKGGHGGRVFLSAEAREYLTLWLKDRDDYIRISDARIKGLKKTGGTRPKKDERLFATSYTGMNKIFSRLYDKVDGEQGKYHAMCTIHSVRKFFRTVAAGAMHPDLVTCLMRQTGYLDSIYIRKTDDEKYKEFKNAEAALYITRADSRIQGSKLDAIQREKEALQARVQQLEQAAKDKDKLEERVLLLEKVMRAVKK